MVEDALSPKSLISAFATPVVAHAWPSSESLNRELSEEILALERRSAGIVRSNVRGWHSDETFFESTSRSMQTVKERIRQMTALMTIAVSAPTTPSRSCDCKSSGWANVSRSGDYNGVHNHPGWAWSGVYYVSSGTRDPDDELNGRLELLDPRGSVAVMASPAETLLNARFLVTPLPGLMVLFPSWLHHMVHPFIGRGERISIAFNVNTTDASTRAPTRRSDVASRMDAA